MNKKELNKLLTPKRGHKYGAKPQECNLGHKHPSRAEANHCWTLQMWLRSGLIKNLEYERKFDLYVYEQLICTHKPDFTFYQKIKGIWVTVIHEVKGVKTPEWNLKLKLFQAIYPQIIYRVID